MNKESSSNTTDSFFTRKHLLYCALFLAPMEAGAVTYENLVLDKSGYWKDITINNVSTPNGGLLIKNDATINLSNADITVDIISGAGIRTDVGKFTAENLKINIKDSQGKAVGVNIGPTSKVNLSEMTLVNHGKGQGIVFNTEENTESVLNLSRSTIETTNGAGIRSMFGLLTLNDVKILARGNFGHAIDMNTGTKDLTIRQGKFTTEGDESYGVWMIHDGGKMFADDAEFYTSGLRSHALVLQQSMPNVPLSEAILSLSLFKTSGDRAYGIYTEGKLFGDNVTINTHGKKSHGIAAVGKGTAELTNSTIETYNDGSYGVALINGARVTGDMLHIRTEGKNSHGIYNDRGLIKLENSNIEVIGENGVGVMMIGDDSTNHFSYLELSQLNPAVVLDKTALHGNSGDSGNAIVSINGASSVKLSNSQINYQNGQAFAALTITDDQQNTFSSALYVDATDSTILGNILATDNNKIFVDLKGEYGVLTGQVTNVESVNLQKGLWNITGTSQLKSLKNDGNIIFAPDNTDHQLIIDGDYSGNGSFTMSAKLSGDNSPINKVIIKGDVVSGSSTAVSIKNLGGLGAETIKGIEVISVGGTSHGKFTQQGRIVAGAYDYNLMKQAESWFLRSELSEPEPKPGPTPRPVPIYRVEAGSYLANFIAGNTLFNTSLFERESDPFEHEQSLFGQNTSNLWLRQVGGRSSWSDSSGQLTTKSNRYVAQLGGGLLHIETPAGGRWSTGVMAGYGHHNNSTASNRVAYRAKGNVNGYSTGLYSTWINENSGKGGYIDSWLLYNWFNNSVKGEQLQPQYYRSKGLTGSVEAGYISEVLRFNGSLGSEYRWYFMPSAQLVYQGVKNSEVIEENNTRISNVGKHNLQSKLGIRSWIRGRHQIDQQTERYFQPFAEVNWIHNSKRQGVRMDSTKVELAGAENIAEIKLGLDAKLSSKGSIWVNTAVQIGNNGYNDNRLTLGGKWYF